MKFALKYEGFLLALAPLGGLLITYFYQVGTFLSLDVPTDFVEINTPKTIASSIAVFFVLVYYAAAFLDLGILSREWNAKSWVWVEHLFVNVLASSFFWFRLNLGWKPLLISAAIFTILFSLASVPFHWAVSRKAREPDWKPSPYASALLFSYIFFVIFIASPIAAGMNNQRGEKLRTLLSQNQNLLLVDSFDGQLIFKCVDQNLHQVVRGKTLLLGPADLVVTQKKVLLTETGTGSAGINCAGPSDKDAKGANITATRSTTRPTIAKPATSPPQASGK